MLKVYFFLSTDRVIYARKAGDESLSGASLEGDKIDLETASVRMIC